MKKQWIKTVAMLAAVLCLLPAGGCTGPADDAAASIVCTSFPPYDFLREITAGVEEVQLTLLLKPGQESHDYDPSSQDILKIHDCSLFVYGGGESDSWIDGVLQSVDTADKTVLSLMDIVQTLPEETVEGMQDMAASDDAYDEHVWTAPANAAAITEALCGSLCAIDPDHAEIYRANTAVYTDRLHALDAEFTATVNGAARRTIVVADRFPLLYFCRAYRLDYHAAFAGCAASVEPSSATVQFLINTVKAQNIPVVFQMELSTGGLAETIAEHTGCRVMTFYACHNLSQTDYDRGETYLSLMQKNLAALKEALN